VPAASRMMEAASTSETLVNFYQTTWCYNPEDSHLHTRHENLKSYLQNITISTFLKLRLVLLFTGNECALWRDALPMFQRNFNLKMETINFWEIMAI
jgi:hypothetical protein